MTITSEPNDTGTFPLIDVSVWRSGDDEQRARIAEQVDACLRETGFLIIVEHGVSEALIDEVRRLCGEVFALPAEIKARYRQAQGIGSPGWTPIGSEANAYASGEASPPDLKEAWTVGPVEPGDVVATSLGVIPVENLFPGEVADFESVVTEYVRAGLTLSADVFELLAQAAEVPTDTFRALCQTPLHNLNLTWYPPLAQVDGLTEPAPGQFRIGPHSDFGTITLLQREESDPPLQIQLADGSWIDLPHVPGAIVVNTGDQLAYWSGYRWRSNPHRIPAPSGEAATRGSLSLVLFVETDVDADLQPIGHPDREPMDATAFLIDKLAAIDMDLP
ncbi:MAG: 2-oxoglutarate and iron-dependent oxygenase domain-containing protein [Actinomycetota bacterium]